MRRAASVVIVATILLLGTIGSAADKSGRGGPPRPAEKPPEYGCVFLDLSTEPDVVREGERIRSFQLRYRCKEKTRPVDIEVWHEGGTVDKQLVKVETGVALEKGERTLHLGGGDLGGPGKYVTILKADGPNGKKEIARRVDNAVCKGWSLSYVEKQLNVGGCEIHLDTEPHIFKPGEKIRKFILKTKCDKLHVMPDIRISWRAKGGDKSEPVAVRADQTLTKGEQTTTLEGGGPGREGYYVLAIPGVTNGSSFKTVCSGWTLSQKR